VWAEYDADGTLYRGSGAGLKQLTDKGVKPMVVEMTAYFPGVSHGLSITTEKISRDADVALLKGAISQLKIKEIAVAEGNRSCYKRRTGCPTWIPNGS
jgi:hypothetical protein